MSHSRLIPEQITIANKEIPIINTTPVSGCNKIRTTGGSAHFATSINKEKSISYDSVGLF